MVNEYDTFLATLRFGGPKTGTEISVGYHNEIKSNPASGKQHDERHQGAQGEQQGEEDRLGAEMKTIADGDTRTMLGLEVVEGVAHQSQTQYPADYGEGIAVVLKVTTPFRGSGRTVVSDSAFASVKTLVQLESRMLFFKGMVKTAAEYPINHLKGWIESNPPRGSFKILSSITDRGTLTNHTNAVRPRDRLVQRDGIVETLRYEKRVKRPQMI
ncbi:hypothetical protein ON010_g17371 [Phytophthora cinnamomi]|nr:hypothetical protein ON010_g17371 [Phytophthora cinnamomi]